MNSVMLIANPYAGSVSEWGKEVLLKALHADFKLEVVETEGRDHASELARDAVERGFHAVVAFGGDGTVNEVAQGVIGTRTCLGILPGGSTNVMARSIGMPTDAVDATAYLARRLASSSSRRINVGRLTFTDTGATRHFLFCAGMGLDAEVVRRVERSEKPKPGRHELLFLRHALQAGWSEYRGRAPTLSLHTGAEEPERVVLAICCNGRPFTYFRNIPVEVCPEARLDGALDLYGLKRLRTATIPRVAWAILVSRSHLHWKSGYYRHDRANFILSADSPLPVQVDGDFIGEYGEVRIDLVRSALDLLL